MIDKLRLYVVITSFFPYVGGAETQTMAQCQRLQESGHTTQVVTFRHKKDWLPREVVSGIPTLRVAGTLLHEREKLPRPIQILLYFLAIFMMAWTVWHHRKRFDVLQICQFNVLVLPLGLVCWLARKPMTIVVISAGADKASKTNAAAKLVAGPLDPNQEWLKVDGLTWIDGDLYGLQSKGKLTVDFTRALLMKIKAVVIVLSSRMQRYLKENDFELPEIELIPNGVDTTRFQPASSETPEQDQERALRVICVSKLRYEKGIDVLLQAWYLVQKQVPEARLVIIGSGPMEAQLERLARELDILGSVEFAGLQGDIPAQLRRGKIGILPSRWEGMSNALLEAMAAGQACIATRVSGSEDLIAHGVNGLLVESEDYEGMAQALLTLLQNPALMQKYGSAARETVEQSYTLAYVTNRYLEVYHRVIARRGRYTMDGPSQRGLSLMTRGILRKDLE